MSFTVILHPRVGNELYVIAGYLEEQRPGFGIAFYDAFKKVVDHLTEYSLAQQKKSGINRIVKIGRFKYIAVYQVHGNDVYINRIIHTSRNPKRRYKK